MKCLNCGLTLNKNIKTCPRCGQKVKKKETNYVAIGAASALAAAGSTYGISKVSASKKSNNKAISLEEKNDTLNDITNSIEEENLSETIINDNAEINEKLNEDDQKLNQNHNDSLNISNKNNTNKLASSLNEENKINSETKINDEVANIEETALNTDITKTDTITNEEENLTKTDESDNESTSNSESTEICICSSICTKDSINTSCPVCKNKYENCEGKKKNNSYDGGGVGEGGAPTGGIDVSIASLDAMLALFGSTQCSSLCSSNSGFGKCDNQFGDYTIENFVSKTNALNNKKYTKNPSGSGFTKLESSISSHSSASNISEIGNFLGNEISNIRSNLENAKSNLMKEVGDWDKAVLQDLASNPQLLSLLKDSITNLFSDENGEQYMLAEDQNDTLSRYYLNDDGISYSRYIQNSDGTYTKATSDETYTANQIYGWNVSTSEVLEVYSAAANAKADKNGNVTIEGKKYSASEYSDLISKYSAGTLTILGLGYAEYDTYLNGTDGKTLLGFCMNEEDNGVQNRYTGENQYDRNERDAAYEQKLFKVLSELDFTGDEANQTWYNNFKYYLYNASVAVIKNAASGNFEHWKNITYIGAETSDNRFSYTFDNKDTAANVEKHDKDILYNFALEMITIKELDANNPEDKAKIDELCNQYGVEYEDAIYCANLLSTDDYTNNGDYNYDKLRTLYDTNSTNGLLIDVDGGEFTEADYQNAIERGIISSEIDNGFKQLAYDYISSLSDWERAQEYTKNEFVERFMVNYNLYEITEPALIAAMAYNEDALSMDENGKYIVNDNYVELYQDAIIAAAAYESAYVENMAYHTQVQPYYNIICNAINNSSSIEEAREKSSILNYYYTIKDTTSKYFNNDYTPAVENKNDFTYNPSEYDYLNDFSFYYKNVCEITQFNNAEIEFCDQNGINSSYGTYDLNQYIMLYDMFKDGWSELKNKYGYYINSIKYEYYQSVCAIDEGIISGKTLTSDQKTELDAIANYAKKMIDGGYDVNDYEKLVYFEKVYADAVETSYKEANNELDELNKKYEDVGGVNFKLKDGTQTSVGAIMSEYIDIKMNGGDINAFMEKYGISEHDCEDTAILLKSLLKSANTIFTDTSDEIQEYLKVLDSVLYYSSQREKINSTRMEYYLDNFFEWSDTAKENYSKSIIKSDALYNYEATISAQLLENQMSEFNKTNGYDDYLGKFEEESDVYSYYFSTTFERIGIDYKIGKEIIDKIYNEYINIENPDSEDVDLRISIMIEGIIYEYYDPNDSNNVSIIKGLKSILSTSSDIIEMHNLCNTYETQLLLYNTNNQFNKVVSDYKNYASYMYQYDYNRFEKYINSISTSQQEKYSGYKVVTKEYENSISDGFKLYDEDGNYVDIYSEDAIKYFLYNEDAYNKYILSGTYIIPNSVKSKVNDMYNLLNNIGQDDDTNKFSAFTSKENALNFLSYNIDLFGESSFVSDSTFDSLYESSAKYTGYKDANSFKTYLTKNDYINIDGTKYYSKNGQFIARNGDVLILSVSYEGEDGKTLTKKLDSTIEELSFKEIDGVRYLVDKDGNFVTDSNGKKVTSKEYEQNGFLDWLSVIDRSVFIDGLKMWANGYSNLVNADGVLNSSDYESQYISEYLSNNYGTFMNGTYQINTSIGNMLPSMIAGLVVAYATGGLGAPAVLADALSLVSTYTFMGLTATGNYMEECLQKGYTTNEARIVGGLDGIGEVLLETFLGSLPGISKVKALENMTGAKRIFGRMLCEGIEEGVQDFWNANWGYLFAQDETNMSELIETASVSFLYGAITGGIMDLPGITIQTVSHVAYSNPFALSTAIKASGGIVEILSNQNARQKLSNIIIEISNTNMSEAINSYMNNETIVAQYELIKSTNREYFSTSLREYCEQLVSRDIAQNVVLKENILITIENINNATTTDTDMLNAYGNIKNLLLRYSNMTINDTNAFTSELSNLSASELALMARISTSELISNQNVLNVILSVSNEFNSSEIIDLYNNLSTEAIYNNNEALFNLINSRVENASIKAELLNQLAEIVKLYSENSKIKINNNFEEQVNTELALNEQITELINEQTNLSEQINKNKENIKNEVSSETKAKLIEENIELQNKYNENSSKIAEILEELQGYSELNNSRITRITNELNNAGNELAELVKEYNNDKISKKEKNKISKLIIEKQAEIKNLIREYANKQASIQNYEESKNGVKSLYNEELSVKEIILDNTSNTIFILGGSGTIQNFIGQLDNQIRTLQSGKEILNNHTDIRSNIKEGRNSVIENIDEKINKIKVKKENLIKLMMEYNLDENSPLSDLVDMLESDITKLKVDQNAEIEQSNIKFNIIEENIDNFIKNVNSNNNLGIKEKENLIKLADILKEQINLASIDSNIKFKQSLYESIEESFKAINSNYSIGITVGENLNTNSSIRLSDQMAELFGIETRDVMDSLSLEDIQNIINNNFFNTSETSSVLTIKPDMLLKMLQSGNETLIKECNNISKLIGFKYNTITELENILNNINNGKIRNISINNSTYDVISSKLENILFEETIVEHLNNDFVNILSECFGTNIAEQLKLYENTALTEESRSIIEEIISNQLFDNKGTQVDEKILEMLNSTNAEERAFAQKAFETNNSNNTIYVNEKLFNMMNSSNAEIKALGEKIFYKVRGMNSKYNSKSIDVSKLTKEEFLKITDVSLNQETMTEIENLIKEKLISEIEVGLIETTEEVNNAVESINIKEEIIDKFNTFKTQLKNTIDTLSETFLVTTNIVNNYNNIVKNINDNINKLTEFKGDLTYRFNISMENVVEDIKLRINELTNKFSSKEISITEIETKINEITTEVEQITSEKANLLNSLNENLSRENNKLNKYKNLRDGKLRNLENIKDTITNKQLEIKTKEIERLSSEITKMESNIKSLETSITEYTNMTEQEINKVLNNETVNNNTEIKNENVNTLNNTESDILDAEFTEIHDDAESSIVDADFTEIHDENANSINNVETVNAENIHEYVSNILKDVFSFKTVDIEFNEILRFESINEESIERVIQNISLDDLNLYIKLDSICTNLENARNRMIPNTIKAKIDSKMEMLKLYSEVKKLGFKSLEKAYLKYGSIKSNILDQIYLQEVVLDDGVRIKLSGETIEECNKMLDLFKEKYNSLPEYLKALIKDVHLHQFASEPYTAYRNSVAKTSADYAATAGMTGNLKFFNTTNNSIGLEKTLYHECGHLLDVDLCDGSSHYSEKHSEWNDAIKLDNCAVSEYGKTSVLEDFAESMMRYYADKESFKNECPNRYTLLEKIIASKTESANSNNIIEISEISTVDDAIYRNSSATINFNEVSDFIDFESRLINSMSDESKIGAILDYYFNQELSNERVTKSDYNRFISAVSNITGKSRNLSVEKEDFYKILKEKYNASFLIQCSDGYSPLSTYSFEENGKAYFELINVNNYGKGIEKTNNKLYLNFDNLTDIYKFSEEFARLCSEKDIGCYFKVIYGSNNTTEVDSLSSVRDDSVVIYSYEEDVVKFASIVQEIIDNHSEFKLSPPPIFTSVINNYIGYGVDTYTSYNSFSSNNLNSYIKIAIKNYEKMYGKLDTKTIKDNKIFIDMIKQNYVSTDINEGQIIEKQSSNLETISKIDEKIIQAENEAKKGHFITIDVGEMSNITTEQLANMSQAARENITFKVIGPDGNIKIHTWDEMTSIISANENLSSKLNNELSGTEEFKQASEIKEKNILSEHSSEFDTLNNNETPDIIEISSDSIYGLDSQIIEEFDEHISDNQKLIEEYENYVKENYKGHFYKGGNLDHYLLDESDIETIKSDLSKVDKSLINLNNILMQHNNDSNVQLMIEKINILKEQMRKVIELSNEYEDIALDNIYHSIIRSYDCIMNSLLSNENYFADILNSCDENYDALSIIQHLDENVKNIIMSNPKNVEAYNLYQESRNQIEQNIKNLIDSISKKENVEKNIKIIENDKVIEEKKVLRDINSSSYINGEKLISEILSTIEGMTDQTEIAKKLYIELNKRVHYNHAYITAEQNNNMELQREIYYEDVSFDTISDNNVVCRGWTSLYVELLQKSGMFNDTIITNLGNDNNLTHHFARIVLKDYVILADATNAIDATNDLINNKYGAKSNGFLIYTTNEYNYLVNKIGRIFTPLKIKEKSAELGTTWYEHGLIRSNELDKSISIYEKQVLEEIDSLFVDTKIDNSKIIENSILSITKGMNFTEISHYLKYLSNEGMIKGLEINMKYAKNYGIIEFNGNKYIYNESIGLRYVTNIEYGIFESEMGY